MRGKQQGGPSHFLAVPLDDEGAAEIEYYRAYMRERYGCQSGHRTEPHITLIPPFAMGDQDSCDLLLEAFMVETVKLPRAFNARAEGFGAFAERTLYVRVVPDSTWNLLREALRRKLVKALSPELARRIPLLREPFIPHLSIANRDLPKGAIVESLQSLETENPCFYFEVNSVRLYQMRDGRWVPIASRKLEAG